VTKRTKDVLGMHLFSPAQRDEAVARSMRAEKAAPDAMTNRGFAVARASQGACRGRRRTA